MIDPVSEELARRAHVDLPWRSAIVGALGLHLAVLATLLLAPSHRQRALSLPAVQVRLAAAPVAPSAGPPRAAPATAVPPAAAPAPRAPAKKAAEPAPRHPLPVKTAPRQAVPAAEQPAPQAAGTGPGRAAATTSGIAVGAGNGTSDETFPFTYYLDRVLALIESNWFRPPAPPDTRCRVRCVIDRSGRLLEAGLEQQSGSAAFDRAALRAVYAAAPLPPLPQGFGGTTLTLHLEFGP